MLHSCLDEPCTRNFLFTLELVNKYIMPTAVNDSLEDLLVGVLQ
jgi:hypothetical protein